MAITVVKVPGIRMTLGGNEYVVPPIALGALEQLEDRIASFNPNVLDLKQMGIIIDCAYAALKRNYPDLTREDVGEIVDIGNMNEVFEAVMDVSGLRRKALENPQPADKAEAGEAEAVA